MNWKNKIEKDSKTEGVNHISLSLQAHQSLLKEKHCLGLWLIIVTYYIVLQDLYIIVKL